MNQTAFIVSHFNHCDEITIIRIKILKTTLDYIGRQRQLRIRE